MENQAPTRTKWGISQVNSYHRDTLLIISPWSQWRLDTNLWTDIHYLMSEPLNSLQIPWKSSMEPSICVSSIWLVMHRSWTERGNKFTLAFTMDGQILPSIFLQMPPKEKLSFYARQLINVNSHHIWLHQIKFSKAKGKKKALGSLKESLLRVMDNK